MSISENPVMVGTMVSTILYNRGRGYVTAVYGEVGKTPVRSLAGRSIMTGGSASFDIVFLTGERSQRLPEAILRGVQWTVYAREDGFADADELERLKTQAEEMAAVKAREKAEAKAAFDAEVERLSAAPDLAHLKQGDEGSGTLAAANLRVLLKKRWPKTRFRVRKQHYGSLIVSWESGPAETEVKEITDRFIGSGYDLMNDCRTIVTTPWNKVFGHADYISLYPPANEPIPG